MTDDAQHVHNFHTHTYRCKHAKGDVADYCDAAIAGGMATLGFSDHAALPDNRWQQARMSYNELDGYIAAVDHAKEAYPTLNVLLGMECEYVPRLHNYFADELLGERRFDYLIGASHFFLDDDDEWHGTYGGITSGRRLRQYADYTVAMMATGMFSFIAHPDLFGNCYADWDADAQAASRDILNAAVEFDVGMEVNALGIRKQAHRKANNPYPLYPWRPFWELAAEIGAPVLVNSDAHRPQDVQARTGLAYAIVEELGLNLMDVTSIGAPADA